MTCGCSFKINAINAQTASSTAAATATPTSTPALGLTSLYSFTNGTDGAAPSGDLILSGGILYGTTYSGGAHNFGAIFSIPVAGGTPTTLYSFTNGNDGSNPQGSLTLYGGALYGTARNGGAHTYGTIFKINTNGTGFSTLYSFTGGADGAWPNCTLTVSGTVFYGVNVGPFSGGSYGTLYSYDTSNSTFSTLYTFSGGADGASPWGKVVIDGSMLYGMAYEGGVSNLGSIYSFDTGNSTFSTLYSFSGNADGSYPAGSLVMSGTKLYGMIPNNAHGKIFEYDTGNSILTTLYNFTNGTDGANPSGSLVISGTTLYGMAKSGASAYGTIFSFETGGSVFTPLYAFTNGADGSNPNAGLILSGSTLYGTTNGYRPPGGPNTYGSVFSFAF